MPNNNQNNSNQPPSGFWAGLSWRFGNLFGNRRKGAWTDSTAPVILKGDKIKDDLLDLNN